MDAYGSFDRQTILDSLNDGVYVTDLERNIVYWSKSAERITGWRKDDIRGKRCCDNILNHIDKDDNQLCAEDLCPLYRCMVTGERSTVPIIIYAQSKDGRRVPMQVSVAPIRSAAGEVTGGVEIFRDMTLAMFDLERAKKIQLSSIPRTLPSTNLIRFSAYYTPVDIIGGDFYTVAQLDENRFAFFLADVMGHGVSSALHTMYLKSSWNECRVYLSNPSRFIQTLNLKFFNLVNDKESFATGIFGLYDVSTRILELVGAGGPNPLMAHFNGAFEFIPCSGFPLGMVKDFLYESHTTYLAPHDTLLLFSDGAVEIHNEAKEELGEDGLVKILKTLGYPIQNISFKDIEKELLQYSHNIRLDDDLTFLEMKCLH